MISFITVNIKDADKVAADAAGCSGQAFAHLMTLLVAGLSHALAAKNDYMTKKTQKHLVAVTSQDLSYIILSHPFVGH